MRRFWMVGALGASLTLAACGATASINQAISSIGASPYLQVHLTTSVSGASSAQAQSILRALSVDMLYSSTMGSPISESVGHTNAEFIVRTGSQSLVDLREIGTNLYVKVDVTAFSSFPGIGVTPQQLAGAQLLIGGRWFEISEGLLTSYLPTTTISTAQITKEQAAVRAVLDSLSSLIERTPYKTLSGGGYSQTGTLQAVEQAVLPAVKSFTGAATTPTNVKGTYNIGFTMSGSTASGASIKITAPNGTKGNATVGLHATLRHDATSVVAPSGATKITRALLSQLLSQVMQTGSL